MLMAILEREIDLYYFSLIRNRYFLLFFGHTENKRFSKCLPSFLDFYCIMNYLYSINITFKLILIFKFSNGQVFIIEM